VMLKWCCAGGIVSLLAPGLPNPSLPEAHPRSNGAVHHPR
jgi:hypothetical protein